MVTLISTLFLQNPSKIRQAVPTWHLSHVTLSFATGGLFRVRDVRFTLVAATSSATVYPT